MYKLKQKLNGIHYTSDELSRFIARRMIKYIDYKDVKILDPACGSSNLLTAFYSEFPSKKDLFIHGIDNDENAIKQSNNLFEGVLNKENYTFRHLDFLEVTESLVSPNLFQNIDDSVLNINTVIANPPYVRTQNLESGLSKKLSDIFNIKGKIDLYQAFIVGMIETLAENGIIGIIVSNKFLSNKSGASTRKYLKDNLDILEIIDLGDSKPFKAAVLPVIIIGRKNTTNRDNSKVTYQSVYSTDCSMAKPIDNLYATLDEYTDQLIEYNGVNFEIKNGKIDIPDDSKELWVFSNDYQIKFINDIHSRRKGIFSDIANIKVGIKSTADKTFIIKDEAKIHDYNIEDNILYSLISSENCQKWQIDYNSITKKVIYPYTSDKLGKNKVIKLEDYPNFTKYITQFEDQLTSRSYLVDSGKMWYEHWVPQNLSKMKSPKIVFKDISEEPRFGIDTKENLVNGNCYWITIKDGYDEDLIYLLLGLANSNLFEKYHRIQFNNKLYSGKLRFNTQYVNKYPLPDLNSPIVSKIISLTKQVLAAQESGEAESLITKINKLVEGYFLNKANK